MSDDGSFDIESNATDMLQEILSDDDAPSDLKKAILTSVDDIATAIRKDLNGAIDLCFNYATCEEELMDMLKILYDRLHDDPAFKAQVKRCMKKVDVDRMVKIMNDVTGYTYTATDITSGFSDITAWKV